VLHCPLRFFNLFLYHSSLRKTKNPREFNPGVL